MKEPEVDDDTLGRAFRALAEASEAHCGDEDVAQVWRAVHGELEPEARRALVARMADEPALAEAWRLAQAFEPPATEPAGAVWPTTGRPAGRRRPPATWLALAALVVLGVSAALLVSQRPRPDADVMREASSYVVESLLDAEATLSRDGAWLRWRSAPVGSRYQVRVTTEDLRVLATAADLEAAELLVAPEALAALESGSTLFWQVDVTLPDGVHVTSETFVNRIR